MNLGAFLGFYCIGVLLCLFIAAVLLHGQTVERWRGQLMMFACVLSWIGVLVFAIAFVVALVKIYRESKE